MPPELELLDRADTAQRTLAQPLLTIAIPTFNRAAQLRVLLEALEPQIAGRPEVEVFVSDNASTDETPQVTASAAAHFGCLRSSPSNPSAPRKQGLRRQLRLLLRAGRRALFLDVRRR